MRDRLTVARPLDANLGPIRARRPDAVAEMARLRRGGVSMDVIAEQYGVSKRTVYRYLEPELSYFEIAVDGWVATFARRPRQAPFRVGPWRRRPS
jgi:AcrR family transcriptional regulator